MFFIASKILWVVAAPTNLLLLLLALGCVLGWTRRARTGRWLAGLAALALLVAAFSPLGTVLLHPLEQRFARAPADMPEPAGIIVLGGALDEDLTALRDQVALTESAGRMTEGMALALRFPSARLVYSGGTAHLRAVALNESDVARRLWRELGLPASRASFEDRSRNTLENAVFTKALLQPKPGEIWLLVTSAYHMPRSVGIFRQAGFPVVPYPVDYRTPPWPHTLRADAAASSNLRLVDTAAREWVGLLAYRLAGRTDALFPGP